MKHSNYLLEIILCYLIAFALIIGLDAQESSDCSISKYECCPDGVTSATSPKFDGCDTDEIPEKVLLEKSKEFDEKNLCFLPEVVNTCFNYTIQWRYSLKDGRCVQYWYGGCGKNGNNFETVEECEQRCVKPNGTDVCKLPLVNPDYCSSNMTRYYYDSDILKCKEFTYNGCLGNNNNFKTISECEKSCQIPLLYDQCSLLPTRGSCKGQYQRWFYDTKTGRCSEFVYGGCLKNTNNFIAQDNCVESCVKPNQKTNCILPKIYGNCNENIDSFYYDFVEGKCKSFMYSGCNGNPNRFESVEKCEYTCQGLNTAAYKNELIEEEICNKPKVTGVCHLNLQRWYFNKNTRMCHQFTYSGCEGNSNNFETEEDCRRSCNAKEVEPCVLPFESGTCNDFKIFWYFNKDSKECVRFYYGGCDGNQNRFDSKESCEFKCKLSEAEKKELLKLPKQCIEPIGYGTDCEIPVQKFHFDITNKECYPFDYSGCGSETANRFDDYLACRSSCIEANEKALETTTQLMTEISSIETNPMPDISTCDLPMETGNCSQKITKWFYDKKAMYCRLFEFTGCNGNDNKFETREQCTEICEHPKRREICHSNKFQGPCQDYQIRWYYDTTTKSCKQFQFGGCLPNENNFPSKKICSNICWLYLSEESRNDDSNDDINDIELDGQVCPSLDSCENSCENGRVRTSAGCETCDCIDPCQYIKCPDDERCVSTGTSATCESKLKEGNCPDIFQVTNSSCTSSCRDDIDCSEDQKCCLNSCGSTHCSIPDLGVDPTIKDFPEQHEFYTGSKLLIKCQASGNPEPHVAWFKDHHEITFSAYDSRVLLIDNKTLVINNLTNSDQGTYSCRASFGDKSDVKETTVVLKEPPAIKFIPETPIFEIGRNESMQCTIGSDAEKIKRIFWYRNAVLLRTNEKYSVEKSNLTIMNFNANDDGRYVCKIKIGSSYIRSKIYVKVKNDNIVEEALCVDVSSYSNCRLVRTQSLCSKWGKYCCRTCQNAGFSIN